jgi:5-methylcytosine-specific restriction endonuclease McrA
MAFIVTATPVGLSPSELQSIMEEADFYDGLLRDRMVGISVPLHIEGSYRYRRATGKVASRRRELLESIKKCQRCGFMPEATIQLELHHIDRNNRNNDLSNLELICANCHRLEHIKRLDIRRNFC